MVYAAVARVAYGNGQHYGQDPSKNDGDDFREHTGKGYDQVYNRRSGKDKGNGKKDWNQFLGSVDDSGVHGGHGGYKPEPKPY